MRHEIRIAGSGGQGIITAGLVLAEAGIFNGHHVVHTQNYGPEARGGTSVCGVIFSDQEIEYPKTLALDILLALTQKACDKNLPDLKSDGLIIIDSDRVEKVQWGKILKVPISSKAKETLNSTRTANMLALGTLVAACPLVSPDSARKAMARVMSPDTVQLNLSALEQGLKLGNLLKKSLIRRDIEDISEL
jgi:2-oxoglutarate ferredoxin oxidoreductase subunit gamma